MLRSYLLLCSVFLVLLVMLPRLCSSQDAAVVVKKADSLYEARDYRDALPLYRQAAVAGSGHAMTRVGYF